ncbi:MAG: hypothetical protein IJJ33_11555 [Victivallales bacterium]|nr:hypothetical protein [Victivallales bacterium]
MTETNIREQARETLRKMMSLLGTEANVTIPEDESMNKLLVAADDAAHVIGRKGQNLEAMELLLNRVLKHQAAEGGNPPWISLDVDGYQVETPVSEPGLRHGKLPQVEIERLQAMAKDLAREVRMLKTAKVIGPLPPAERRIIHLTLENDPMVETVSDPEPDARRGKRITIRLRDGQP